jgi:hypothetical protein
MAEIPLFIASYKGWKTMGTLQSYLDSNPNISGILVIEGGLFISSPSFGGLRATGPWALWGLISVLHEITNSQMVASTNPRIYAM